MDEFRFGVREGEEVSWIPLKGPKTLQALLEIQSKKVEAAGGTLLRLEEDAMRSLLGWRLQLRDQQRPGDDAF